jgi:hypothetical protein
MLDGQALGRSGKRPQSVRQDRLAGLPEFIRTASAFRPVVMRI